MSQNPACPRIHRLRANHQGSESELTRFGEVFRGVHLSESACQADLACKATTYNKKARFCFLKSDAKILVRNADAVASIQSNLTGSVIMSTFIIRSGRDMAGGDYSRIRNTNFISCYAQCEMDVQCRAFSYVRKKNECWLKDRVGYVSAKPGVDLGLE